LNVGQPQTFTASVSGGFSNYTYVWYVQNSSGWFKVQALPSQAGSNQTWTFTPSSFGSYAIYVGVTDNATVPVTVRSPTYSVATTPIVTASSILSAAIYPTNSTIYLNESLVFTSNITGDTSPYEYQWYVNGNPFSRANNSSWIFTGFPAGSYLIYLNITDSMDNQAISNNATVTVAPLYHNVAVVVTKFILQESKTVVCGGAYARGINTTTNVTVSNQGGYNPAHGYNVTFTVAVYVTNTTTAILIANQTLTLAIGNSATITFTWNTTSLAYGNYALSANVTLLSGETNIWTGPLKYEPTIKVTIPGDINGDGVVDGKDLHILAQNWLETVPPALANADIGCYGVVAGEDLHILAQHWLDTI
jgi:hypothetical protein